MITRIEAFDKLETLKEILSEETILSEMFNYMSSDEANDFIEKVCREYDIELAEEA